MTNLANQFDEEILEGLRYGDVEEGYEIVVDETIDGTSRWGIDYFLVFKHNDKFYKMSWESGATEYQEIDFDPWVVQVYPKTKTVTVYETNE